jgi:hypothetical protein
LLLRCRDSSSSSRRGFAATSGAADQHRLDLRRTLRAGRDDVLRRATLEQLVARAAGCDAGAARALLAQGAVYLAPSPPPSHNNDAPQRRSRPRRRLSAAAALELAREGDEAKEEERR